jgi:DSF synthase
MQSIALSHASAPSRAITWPLPLALKEPAAPPNDAKLLDLMKGAAARRLFKLEQLEVSWDEQANALWTFMRPRGRPSYNLELLEDIHALQRGIVAAFEDRPNELHYLVAGSRTPGVFSLGGDLHHFMAKIHARDRQALVDYGESCVRVLHRFLNALDLPIITIGLAQGDALGGGFESLLSFNVVIAERGAKFGFPETMFGLFPGMGAYSIVSRRVGAAFAEEMMLSGRIYSADEMKEIGLVHMVVEPGQGVDAARDYMRRNQRRHVGARAVYKVSHGVNPITLAELDRIVQIWSDACLQLRERDLKVMQRLLAAQDKMQYAAQAAE